MLPKKFRITAKDFSYLRKNSQSFVGSFCILHVARVSHDRLGIGLITPKKHFPLAVSRSRVRRRLYHALRESGFLTLQGALIALLPRQRVETLAYEKLCTDLVTLRDQVKKAVAVQSAS